MSEAMIAKVENKKQNYYKIKNNLIIINFFKVKK